ncbi:MAG: MEDS domain-containing protein [Chloroflexi bacterium]|nr:MEDS domain-containing protein [Chloroflexota bacterium]
MSPGVPLVNVLERGQAADARPEFYSISQAAALLSVSRMTLWRWISAGELPACRLGHRTTRIRRGDLEEFAVRRRVTAPRLHAAAVKTAMRRRWTHMRETEHFVQFYEHDQVLLDAVSGYLLAGLQSGEAAVVVASCEHLDELQRRLAELGVSVATEHSSGRLILLDAAETLTKFMVGSSPDADLFDQEIGNLVRSAARDGRHVRAFGEMVALLVSEGNSRAAVQLEALWSELQRRSGSFSLFCAYPMESFREASLAGAVRQVCDEHSQVIPAESYTNLDAPDHQMRAIAMLQQKARALEAEVEERKSAEEQLHVALAMEHAAREETQAALRLRDEFLSVASHELRTPLAALNGQVQLALRRIEKTGEVDPQHVARTLARIRGQGDKLARLLGQLLDVSRIEAGKLTIDPEPLDLCLLVAEVVKVADSVQESHSFVVRRPESLYARVDSLRMEQVLTNLLDNAVKYSPEGGQIDVTLRKLDDCLAEIAVRDRGLGIPVEKREGIFDAYYQAHGAAYRSGMGLGLYISRQIVELHGGQITAEFPLDGGTRLVVRLPTGGPTPRD